MKKVLFTLPLSEERMEAIKDMGYTLEIHSEKDDLSELTSDAEVFITYRGVEKHKPENFTNLEYIQLSSTGIDQVPLAFEEAGVLISNNKGGYSRSIGEFTVARLLEVYKKLREIDEDQHNKKWKVHRDLEDLYGKKILLIGTGSIASEIAMRLQAFQCHVVGLSVSGQRKEYFDVVITKKNLKDHLKESDVVIGTLPKTKDTDDFFDDTFFETMKEGSVFVNVARGNAVDEEALLKHSDKFRAIILDVFKEEPLKENHPFRELSNVYLSSHNSWISETVNDRREEMILENLRRFKEGEALLNLVSLKKGY